MLPKYYYERKRKEAARNKVLGILIFIMLSLIIALIFLKIPTAKDVSNEVVTNTVNENSSVEILKLFSCGHTRTEIIRLPDELKNKSIDEIKSLKPNWSIMNSSNSILNVEEKVEGQCDDHYLVKLDQSKIKVYKKSKPGEIYKEIKIMTDSLTDEDKEILYDGIEVSSEYELLEVLESFSELK